MRECFGFHDTAHPWQHRTKPSGGLCAALPIQRGKFLPPAAGSSAAHGEPSEQSCVRRNGEHHVQAESEPEPSAAAEPESPEPAGTAEAEPVCPELPEPAGRRR